MVVSFLTKVNFISEYQKYLQTFGCSAWGLRRVTRQTVAAYAWFSLSNVSATEPDSNVAAERDAVARQLSPQQLSEGQRLAREWRPGNALGQTQTATR